jgi:hypothetical protein
MNSAHSTLLTFRAGCAAVVLLGGASTAARTPVHSQDDRAAVIALERRWLAAEHDSATLEEILAPDFTHVVPTGDFLNKAQHIHYAVLRRPPAGHRERFDTLAVRMYGNVAIATGIVATTDAKGSTTRSIFTDVFARRDGRWQAVNAQENRVEVH